MEKELENDCLSPRETIQKIRAALSRGHAPVEPPALRGMSGILHTFSLLITHDGQYCAFDVYNSVGQLEVLRTHVKIYDTGASGYIISQQPDASPGMRELSRQYGLSLLTTQEMDERRKEGDTGEHESTMKSVVAQMSCSLGLVHK